MGNTKSLYKMIVDEIEEGIRDRKYKPGDRIPTENELAQKFGVSRITVTRATQELELKGYIYRNKRKGSFICDSLDPLSMGKAAIASPSRGNLFLPLVMPFKEQIGYDILHGVEEEVKKYHHFVSVHNTGYDEFEERNIVETLIKNDVKGMIVYPCSSQKNISLFSGLLIKKMPFVLIDRAIEGIEAPLVTSNNHKGFMDLISYLFSLGHKKIGFVSTSMKEFNSSYNRYRGYCQAHIDAGIEVSSDLIYDRFLKDWQHIDDAMAFEDINLHAANETLDYYMNMKDRPTAIAAVNDMTAIFLVKAAIRKGIAIPQDLSITGFDNLSMCEHLDVPLTTVEQPFAAIGARAAQLLISSIKNETTCIKHELVDTKLVIRNSTSPPKG